jgi:hypothetical protein
VLSASQITQPGRYRYMDLPGAVIVVVMDDDGMLVACFPPDDCDDGANLPLMFMAGTFEGPLP